MSALGRRPARLNHNPRPCRSPVPRGRAGDPNETHEENDVNKTDLIAHIAQQADLSKASATRALEAALEGVQTALKNGDSVAIAGFGTFEVSERAARTGRNPRTGEAIEVKAAKVPKFRPGKALKDLLG
nr:MULTISPECIES: HU family DNA-binding protein [unclassified Rubrivivax]